MKWRMTFLAGLVAGTVMTVLLGLLRFAGIPMGVQRALGTTLVGVPDAAAWITGAVMFIAGYALFALVYSFVFRVSGRAGVVPGFVVGAVHGFVALVVLAVFPLASPGAVLGHMGWLGGATFFAAHIAYGGVVGAFFEPETPSSLGEPLDVTT